MVLTAHNIRFRHGQRFELAPVSLELQRGTLTGLIGPNGSGKTTLIRLLCGFLEPQEGVVRLLGRDLSSWSQVDRARHITYVSQTWRPAFPFTVEQAVLLGRTPWRSRYGGFESPDDLRAADDAIRVMDLRQLRQALITELSGGELQRVMIAAALAQMTDVIILDEPTTHLDISHQQRTLEAVLGIARDRSVAVLASIHDLNLASIYCDSLHMLSEGREIAAGAPEDVLTETKLRSVYGVELDVEPERYGSSPGIAFRPGTEHLAHAS
jgi:iron complex transport system ATP-binding protein